MTGHREGQLFHCTGGLGPKIGNGGERHFHLLFVQHKQNLIIKIEVGDIIEYKDKTPLEENYRTIFNLK